MTIITLDELRRIAPTSPTKFADWVAPLNAAMAERAITTEQRVEMFVTQCMHESGMFATLVENLNYSAQGLANTWDRYSASGKRGGAPNALALRLNRQATLIANNVYASRLGNGDEASGDGWNYRGRGLIQLTGKANYQAAKVALGIDCVANPALLETIVGACRSAAWFWQAHGLNAVADTGNFKGTTAVVNGGDIGGAERIGLWTLVEGIVT